MPSHSFTVDWESLSLRATFAWITAVPIVFLVAPILIVILASLTASQWLKFPPDGLSLRWYVALLKADQMQQAAWTSLVVAFWATLLCAVLGTAAALAISRSGRIWARFFDLLLMSPLFLPALDFGFASLVFIYQLGCRPSIAFLIT